MKRDFTNIKKSPFNAVGFLLGCDHGDSPAKDVEKENEKKRSLLPTSNNETELGPVESGEEIADAGADAEHPAVEAEARLLGHLGLAGHDVAHQSFAGVDRCLAGVVKQHHSNSQNHLNQKDYIGGLQFII